MRIDMPKPVNQTQQEFKKLCELGGGIKGGPATGKVRELLASSGKRLNKFAHRETTEHMNAHADANPWYVCFAISLSWGHLAKLDPDFTSAVVGALTEWNDDDLAVAKSFHMERGPEPIEHSLIGAHMLFERVTLPSVLPSNLRQLAIAQERWFSPILSTDRPRYIGSWNASAMFMVALFAQPSLAATHLKPPPILPPGGPIFAGLNLLYKAGVLSRAPEGNALDDEAFEPGALYINNDLLSELRTGMDECSMIDVHSGVYMLGTRHPLSDTWV